MEKKRETSKQVTWPPPLKKGISTKEAMEEIAKPIERALKRLADK